MLHQTFIAALATTTLIASLLDVAFSGGSCQSYGHSCLGGHGKRTNEPPMALHLLLQQALRARERQPFYDFRSPESETYDFLKGFTDNLKGIDDNNSK